jgi:endonuclease YncB( thermonuclease family)
VGLYQTNTDELTYGMVEGKQVHCLQVGLGTLCDGQSKQVNNKRKVAQCFVGDRDIAAEMVRLRQACDWPHFSGGHYRIARRPARRKAGRHRVLVARV